jgi:hypothetical protein
MTITPGYSWRIDLDVRFDGVRPPDWPDWVVRMHVWGSDLRLSLTPGAGVTYEPVDDIAGETSPITMPVIRMTAAQTETFRQANGIQYVIDLKAPGGEAEDYFAGALGRLPGPPTGMAA